MSIKGEAVQRLASAAGDVAGAVARKVDDWGWKGGKPGEVTGHDFVKAQDVLRNARGSAVKPAEDSYYALIDKVLDQMAPAIQSGKLPNRPVRVRGQYGPNATRDLLTADSRSLRPVVEEYMRTFYRLEKAGVPREFTGKLANHLISSSGYVTPSRDAPWPVSIGAMNNLSGAVRDLGDNTSRGAFLDILPTWGGSVVDLGLLASKLPKLPRLQQEFIRQSAGKLSERGMSTDQILNLARATFGG